MRKYMILKNRWLAFMFCSLTLLVSSCDLDEVPYDFISPEQVGDSDAAADKWVMGVYNQYAQMFRYSEFPAVLEYDCDYTTGPSWAFGELGAGNFQGNSKQTDNLWTYCYIVIHRSNVALFNIEKMKHMTERHKKNVKGELYFSKAFAYFLLVRAYGEIPIYLKSVNEGESHNQPRQSIRKVYEHIIALLTDAKDMMYKNTDKEFVAGRTSAGAAASLLAKVYVTIGSASLPSGELIVRGGKPYDIVDNTQIRTYPTPHTYQKQLVKGYESFNSAEYFGYAGQMAKDVIDGIYGTYDLLPFTDLWTQASKNKTEHIWSVQSLMGDMDLGNHLCRDFCGLQENNQIIQGMWYGLRDHWYKLFEPQDLRIVDGVFHRWSRNFDYKKNIGTFYPNNDEFKKKAQGYDIQIGTDPVTGKPITEHIAPVAPYNDGLNYGCGSDANYLAFLTKYSNPSDRTRTNSDVNYPFLRFADVLLIYAEATNEVAGAPTTDALEALNRVRRRSNAMEKKLSGDGHVGNLVAFRSAVLEERAMELAAEGDRRWDLIRWGIYLPVMNSIGTLDEVGVTKIRTEKHILYPLPTAEILSNTMIKENNPGWN